MSLELTRKPGQVILIGHNIKVTVMEVKGQHVKIAIDAPNEVKVDRYEVRKAKEERKKNG
jgi:carbon storage regulator